MVYCIMMLFLGMISGFAFGSDTVAYIGVCGASICFIVAIIQEYIKLRVYKNIKGLPYRCKKIDKIVIRYSRMSRLRTDIEETFTIEEIMSGLIDFYRARINLTSAEYEAVRYLRDKIVQQIKISKLNIAECRRLNMYLVVFFDMVAPFSKCCKDGGYPTSSSVESRKESYRIKARKLIMNNKIFSRDWNRLFNKFFCEFMLNNT